MSNVMGPARALREHAMALPDKSSTAHIKRLDEVLSNLWS